MTSYSFTSACYPVFCRLTMALVSTDTRISEFLGNLHQLIKQTQEERSRSEHNLLNIQKTHERMQTEQKISPYYRTKLRGLYTTAKADAEAECNILRKTLGKIAEIKSLLEERRIAARNAGLYNDTEPPRKTMRRGVLMTLLQQSAMTLPLWIGKPGDKPPPLCGAIPASSDYVVKPGDKVAARVKGVDGDEQWILAEVVSYSHTANKYEVDDIDEEGKERHTLSRRRIIPLPQWKANPETDPEALFQKEQLVLALYPQTTCFYRALIHSPPQRVRVRVRRCVRARGAACGPEALHAYACTGAHAVSHTQPLSLSHRRTIRCCLKTPHTLTATHRP
uniref:SAGA complex associated factor 29 n=2 Tax=Callorhinchus milii TaxID=7868 RepID=A0A4W3GIL4_CALMI